MDERSMLTQYFQRPAKSVSGCSGSALSSASVSLIRPVCCNSVVTLLWELYLMTILSPTQLSLMDDTSFP